MIWCPRGRADARGASSDGGHASVVVGASGHWPSPDLAVTETDGILVGARTAPTTLPRMPAISLDRQARASPLTDDADRFRADGVLDFTAPAANTVHYAAELCGFRVRADRPRDRHHRLRLPRGWLPPPATRVLVKSGNMSLASISGAWCKRRWGARAGHHDVERSSRCTTAWLVDALSGTALRSGRRLWVPITISLPYLVMRCATATSTRARSRATSFCQ